MKIYEKNTGMVTVVAKNKGRTNFSISLILTNNGTQLSLYLQQRF
jgi:hypothetical protein